MAERSRHVGARHVPGRLVALAVGALLALSAPAAASATVFSNVFHSTLIVRSDAADAIVVDCDVSGFVTVNGADPDSGQAFCVDIRALEIYGGPGANTINLSNVGPAKYPGVSSVVAYGVDYASYSTDAGDFLIGSAFNDALYGGIGGGDTIRGRAGNDYIVAEGTGNLDGQAAADSYVVSLAVPGTMTVGDIGLLGTDTLAVEGTSGGDTVYVTPTQIIADVETVTYSAMESIAVRTYDGNDSVSAPTATLPLDLRGGNDSDIIEGGTLADRLDGEGGVDTVSYANAPAWASISLWNQNAFVGGSIKDDVFNFENVVATPFNDFLLGDTGNNVLNGLGGNDSFQGLAGDDTMLAGLGTDQINYNNAPPGGVTVNLAAGTASGDGNDILSGFEDVIGSFGNDTIFGDAGPNQLFSWDGDDLVNGDDGADTIIGGPGNDEIYTGPGDDTVYEDSGDDYSENSSGNDYLAFTSFSVPPSGVTVNLTAGTASGLGNDSFSGFENVFGSSQGDLIIGDGNANQLIGGYESGADTIQGRGGDDGIYGYDGTDKVDYSVAPGSVTVDLAAGSATGDGNDLLSGIENVNGSPVADVIAGDGGDNVLNGGTGNDRLIGRGGNDQLNGGLGINLADFSSAPGGVIVDLPAGTATGDGSDQLAQIIQVIGSAFDDTLKGNAGANLLRGGGGNDQISGGGANDMLVPGPGNDAVAGDLGSDTIDLSGAPAALFVDLAAGTASGEGSDTLSTVENVIGSPFDDTIGGEGSANLLRGEAGNDALAGRGGNDNLVGGPGINLADFSTAPVGVSVNLVAGTAVGDGSDVLSGITKIVGSPFNDTLDGNTAPNVLWGMAGNDQLSGNDGPDVLDGGLDDDLAFGDNGDDTLRLGAGNDDYRGGPGVNTADFSASAAGVSVNLTAGSALGEGVDVLVDIANVIGSGFADTITGNAGPNRILAGAGDDVIRGANGNDTALGGPGNDTIAGGPGDDFAHGEDGDDALILGPGDDTYRGGLGVNRAAFVASPVGVTVDLVAGTATGEGTDTISGISDLTGSAFDDILRGNDGNNLIRGGNGNDDLFGRGGNDSLYGDNGDDNLDGGTGTDSCFQGPGTGTIVNCP